MDDIGAVVEQNSLSKRLAAVILLYNSFTFTRVPFFDE